ncbi:hypothetical protein IV203_016570 [Nitzschia inconspicua]|uniref:Uncharacterized protein n=1 Tax=Nitzschia inconspicua TaxID=303405 RepID=A0A9K3KRG6_9STRA|nr:hypothetical protein IV203_016570 [Nitzschia inconspicua]
MRLSLHGSRQSPSRQKALNGMAKELYTLQDPCTPADHVLTDNSIETIISAMWEGPDYTNFYNDICDKSHHASSLVTKMEYTLTWLLQSLDSQTILSSLPMNPMATSPPNDPTLISHNTNTDGTQFKVPAVILPSPKKRPALILNQPTPSSLS